MNRTKTMILVAVKLIITASAVYLLMQRIDIKQAFSFRVVSISALIFTLFCAVLLVFIQAVRWYFVANSTGISIRLKKAVVAVWFGHFLNNMLPTSAAGDLVRNYTLKYEGGRQGRWIAVFVTEKFVTMLTALVVASTAASITPSIGMPQEVKLLVLLVLVAMVFGYVFLLAVRRFATGYLSHRLRTYLSETVSAISKLATSKQGRGALLLSFTVNIGMALIFFMASKVVGVGLDFSTCLFVVPVFSVIASLPISYGGWGVRELSGVHLLGLVGIGSDAAFAVTMVYGIINLLSCLPGLFAGRIFVRSAKLKRLAHHTDAALRPDDKRIGTWK